MSRLIPSLAFAISIAEGFGIVGAIPTLANNPGDLELGDIGFGTLGYGITIYESFADGCRALYHELDLILTNNSSYYSTSMTFTQLARTWTGNDNAIEWADTVCGILKIFPDTTIQSWMVNHV
jgi:hypothetical protein